MMYNKILLPVDGSNFSNKAVEAAISFCKGRQEPCKLTLLHVLYLGYYNFEISPTTANKIAEEIISLSASRIQTAGIHCDSVIRWGSPAKEICSLAEQGNYELIVMGSRGLGQLGEFLLGSVSHKVLHHAPCPVLIVK